MDLTAAHCGAYEVWGPISEGGMSRVFLARHRELSTPVVIKTLLEGGDEAFARLRNEARLMARIPNAQVVRAVDVGTYGPTPYLVQEYVDGLDLAELDRRRRSALRRGLPLWFVCSVVDSIGAALESAHQTGVLHRDVKPSNLFGSPQTGIRLGDFGIATVRGHAAERSSGTLRFIAPEALRGDPPTRAWDVYSLGATAFDLYYGRPPVADVDEILKGASATFPLARRPEEAYFQHVLAAMLERSPEKRFASVKTPRRFLAPLGRSLRPAFPGVWLAPGEYQVGSLRVSCRLGDIASSEVEGIVSSANETMAMRSGVGAALRKRGGDAIEEEAMAGGRRALGDCLATGPGTLSCKKVLHAVSAWKEASCIARTVQRALLTAEELGLRSLAFPALGTGEARVAPEACAYATAMALYWHVLLGGTKLREVRFVLYDKTTFDIFTEELDGVFRGEREHDAEAAPPREVAFEETLDLSAITQS